MFGSWLASQSTFPGYIKAVSKTASKNLNGYVIGGQVGQWKIGASGLGYIPVAFQVATLLAAFAHPGHVVFLRSRGFAQLPPCSHMKSIRYSKSPFRIGCLVLFFRPKCCVLRPRVSL